MQKEPLSQKQNKTIKYFVCEDKGEHINNVCHKIENEMRDTSKKFQQLSLSFNLWLSPQLYL